MGLLLALSYQNNKAFNPAKLHYAYLDLLNA